jgi:hypothetical protein
VDLYVDPYDESWLLLTLEPNIHWTVRATSDWQDDALEWEGVARIFDDVANRLS